MYPISRRNGVLKQAEGIDANGSSDVGAQTEGGLWKFFRDAIKNKEHYDNIFIFSDMQAGCGGLYGTSKDFKEYHDAYGFRSGQLSTWKFRGLRVDISNHINVYKLILDYRKKVNPKVNVFSVQTAGYNNVVVPQMAYRCAMLTGWTGKEVSFAAEYIKQWDDIEDAANKRKKEKVDVVNDIDISDDK
jgi:hypothetical protein